MRPGDAFFIDAMVGHGRLRMDSRRIVEPIDDMARLARRGRVDFGALAFGLEHEIAPLVLAPYARLDVARHRLGEATETAPAPTRCATWRSAVSTSAWRSACASRRRTKPTSAARRRGCAPSSSAS